MKIIANSYKQKLILMLVSSSMIFFNPVMAKSDKEMMAEVQRARVKDIQGDGHAKHFKPINEKQKYRGVFYGYLPCDHCAGIKMTLSLKNRNNYLLVTQYAQASTKEFYEKGKYTWDEKLGRVTLTARKDSKIKKLQIKDAGSLIMLSPDGTPMKGSQDQYTLLSGDKKKTREVHIH